MADALTRHLIQRLRARGGSDVPRTRTLLAYAAAGISIALNLGLCLGKLAVGVMIGSISVIADALHTGSDVLTSGIVLWGFWAAGKPADEEHPFGHGRMEYIAALVIAVLLCVAGIELIKQAAGRFLSAPRVEANAWVVGFLVASMLLKEWMARMAFAFGRAADSPVLKADGWHHRTDAISTGLVIVAMAGAMAGVFILDSILGIAVAVYIIFTGWNILREAVTYLLGRRIDPQTAAEIHTLVQGVSGVEGIHDIIVHDYGSYKAISLHVEVNPSLNAREAHAIAQHVEQRIASRIPSSPIVHIDLRPGPQVKESAAIHDIESLRRRYRVIHGFHGVRLSSSENGNTLRLHVVVPRDLTVAQAHRLEHRFSKELSRFLGDYAIHVHIEPCTPTCRQCRASPAGHHSAERHEPVV